MNVGFYLTREDATGYVLADMLMASVHDTMPGVQLTQFTDPKSPPVDGVDHVRRLPAGPLSLARSRHYAAVEGDWLFLDTDTLVLQDVRDVFTRPFDIAVTDRHWPHLPPLSEEFTAEMPYCAGVVFSRSSAFWVAVHHRVSMLGEKDQWYGDQRALAQELATGKYTQLTLPGVVYQYPPLGEEDDLSQVAIAHFKGKSRKAVLLKVIQREYLGSC